MEMDWIWMVWNGWEVKRSSLVQAILDEFGQSEEDTRALYSNLTLKLRAKEAKIVPVSL